MLITFFRDISQQIQLKLTFISKCNLRKTNRFRLKVNLLRDYSERSLFSLSDGWISLRRVRWVYHKMMSILSIKTKVNKMYKMTKYNHNTNHSIKAQFDIKKNLETNSQHNARGLREVFACVKLFLSLYCCSLFFACSLKMYLFECIMTFFVYV